MPLIAAVAARDRGGMNGTRISHLWYDVGWPVLAGLVAAVGVIAAYRTLGLLAVVAAFALMELTIAPTAWSIVTEMGRPGAPAIFQVGPACALGTVVVIGLIGSWGAWGLPVIGLVAFTSPWVRRRAPQETTPTDTERAETRRAFDDIMAHSWALPYHEDDSGR